MNTTKLFSIFIFLIACMVMPVSAFEDDFNDKEIISDWNIITGTWSVLNTSSILGSDDYYAYNANSATGTTEEMYRSVSGDYSYYEIDMKAYASLNLPGASKESFVFSSNGVINHSINLQVNYPDAAGTYAMITGEGFTYSTVSLTAASGAGFLTTAWYHIEITTTSNNIKIEVFDIDNNLIDSQTNAYTPLTDNDRIILQNYYSSSGNAKGYFDNILLSSVSPSTVNGIEWDLDQYTEGETASYSWNLQNSFWQDLIYKYRVQILKDGLEIDTVRVSQTGTRYQEVDTAGTYEVKLQYSGLIFTNWQTLDSDNVNVIPQVDSFINVPQTAPQKTNFTVNYLYGTSPPTAAIFVKKLDEQLEAYVLYDIVYLDGGTANTDYSQNMSIWGEGFYKLVLYNANVPEADLKTDVIQITTVIIPPQTRIDTSRIRSQLDTYSISDMVWGDYAADFTNYTSYVINLELYNYEYDAVVYSETVKDQYGVILIPLYDSDLTIFTGEHNVRLSSYSNTGVFVDDIVHDNFTINLVNPAGYGLTLSKYEVYSDETFVIKCIVPQPSTLKIINRLTLDEIDDFEVNASSYINYQIAEIGNYEIRLIGASGYVEGNQYIKVVEGTIIDDPVDEDEIVEEDVAFDTKFESMLSSGSFIALLIIIACVGAFGKIGGVVGVFLGMVVGISISFLMGYLPAWILFIMVLALCVVFVSKLINSFGGGE